MINSVEQQINSASAHLWSYIILVNSLHFKILGIQMNIMKGKKKNNMMICNPNVFLIIMIIIIAVYNWLFVNLTPSKSNFKYAN